jgi:hypothetical protein
MTQLDPADEADILAALKRARELGIPHRELQRVIREEEAHDDPLTGVVTAMRLSRFVKAHETRHVPAESPVMARKRDPAEWGTPG